MKYLVLASRITGGLVFIFSGFVKGIDPVGSQIKFADYLTATGISMPDTILLAAAMVLCAAELITGIMIITGSFYKAGVILYALFMAIFTPLTLILAIFNPVSDCGCFGDAVHLTNWQTFFKNLLLVLPGVVMFADSRKKRWFSNLKSETLTASLTLLFFTLFMVANVRWLPVIDFRPYKVGVNLVEAMSIPEGAPHDQYETTLIYEREGIRQEFTLSNYPADDTTWKFVDQKSVLTSKGYEPPVRDFHLSDLEGREITDLILYNQGYTLLMISHNLEKAGKKDLDAGFLKGFGVAERGIEFLVVTASPRNDIDRYLNGLKFSVADGTLLKTIVRSNPGYVLIGNGTILAKWSPASLPSDNWFSSDMTAAALSTSEKKSSVLVSFAFFLLLAIIGLFRGLTRD